MQIKHVKSERIVNSANPFNWFSVGKMINQENADLVVFDWWHPYFGPCHNAISSLIKKKYRKKILFITENFISHEAGIIDRTLSGLGLKHASSIMALSDKVVKDISSLAAGRKIYKAELPVYDCYKNTGEISSSDAKVRFGFNPDDKVILFFGYIRKYKGLDILLEAMPLIIKEDPSVKLLVAGEFYDEFEFYKRMLAPLGIEKHVYMLNKFIPNEEVEKYFAPSDVVILPYRSGTQSGILNVAYGFLKPAIVTNVGGLGEFVDEGKTGYIIEPDSEKAIAESVLKFYRERESIDFAEHIIERTRKNSFNNLPEIFDRIIKDSE
jgi:glycosyltransferase involved in cell wall biosynthesis